MQSIRRPKLFWVSACAPLASVIISTLLVYLFKAQNHGISIVRTETSERNFVKEFCFESCLCNRVTIKDFFVNLFTTDWAAQVWPESPLMGQATVRHNIFRPHHEDWPCHWNHLSYGMAHHRLVFLS
jgi:hypothetical protein